MTDRTRPEGTGTRFPVLPALIALADAVLLLFSLAIWLTRRTPLSDLTDAYLIGDAAIGIGFAVGGALITLRVRRNLIGWLMLSAGSLYLIATAVGSLAFARLADGDNGAGTRLLMGVFGTIWFPAIAVLIPAAIQLFPTGRPANRFWAAWLVGAVLGGIGATVSWVFGAELFTDSGLADQRPLLTGGLPGWLDVLVTVLQPLGVLVIGGGFLVPLFRLVFRPGEERLQVLWLVEAALVVLAVNAPTTFLDAPPPVPLLSIPLIPLAMTAAVLRYRLYGITLVVNRTLVYLVLTLSLLAAYLGVVFGLSRIVASTGVREVLATAVVAVAFAPLRSLLQRLVDRLMFGAAADPYGVLADLGRRLQTAMTPDRVLPTIATTLSEALRLPYVLVRAGRPGAEPLRSVEIGSPTGPTSEFPLTHRGEQVGTLVVGVPDRPRPLTGHRGALLDDLVRQAGPAVHAVVLTEELDASRQRTIAALEDERSRIRRDLHDGLGPTLTGVVLKSEAAQNLAPTEPARAGVLMGEVAEETRSAVADVRRLVYGLRPPSLDRQGLRSALCEYVDRLGTRPAVHLDLPSDLPRLAPEVEVAAYRIVTEALANVARHSTAASAAARLWVDDGSLHLEVCDDGGTPTDWVPGVGLTSMRERTEQLGGGFAAAGSPSGGQVTAWIPLATG